MRMHVVTWIVAALWLPGIAIAEDNRLTDQERESGWQLLFNGKHYSGWKCNNDTPVGSPIEDGCLVPYKSGGYLVVHEKPYGDFVLRCDVRWEEPRCNSGIFFRVEDLKNPVHTGFEIQVMGGKGVGKHAMGAIYDLAPTTKNAGRDTGQWNTFEIRCEGPHIQVTLNGEMVCQIDCDEYTTPGECPDGSRHKYKLDGKPRAVKDFARSGYLGFQDHGHKVWYKNIKLLELKEPEE